MDILFLLVNVLLIAGETFFFGQCIDASNARNTFMIYMFYAPSFLLLLTIHMAANAYFVLKCIILRKDKKIVDKEEGEEDVL